MGTFLALSAVIGKTKTEVENSLTNYARSVGGGLEQADNTDTNTGDYCILEEADGNASVFYPSGYVEWDTSAAFISKELNTTVFSFHIHDGDLWMYVLYHNGQVVDQFNPIPDYWDDDLSEEEIDSWKGDAQTIANLISYVDKNDIDKYLVRWDWEDEDNTKAYSTDEFAKEDWQLLDFMSKLKLPHFFNDYGIPVGQAYKLWTN